VLSYEEMLQSEHARARSYVVDVPGGPTPVLGFPARVDGRPLPETRPAPRQGEHAAEVFPARDPALICTSVHSLLATGEGGI
jgi:crotonobetainyl-CoA:carnitine CoA-transferase CaiB-like acyl-CoA transferase